MRVRSSKMRVFSFDRYMKFPLALHIEIYTVSRGFLATDGFSSYFGPTTRSKLQYKSATVQWNPVLSEMCTDILCSLLDSVIILNIRSIFLKLF